MSDKFTPRSIEFHRSGRGKAQCPPDPRYPDGMVFDASDGALDTCFFTLPYPAPECGFWILRCAICDQSVAISAAGRPDDPREVRLACLKTRLPVTEEVS